MKDLWVCGSDMVRNTNHNIVHGIVHPMCQQNLNHMRDATVLSLSLRKAQMTGRVCSVWQTDYWCMYTHSTMHTAPRVSIVVNAHERLIEIDYEHYEGLW